MFGLCKKVSIIMRGYDQQWAIAGGWAIDLHLGKETREHGDIEIAVYRNHQQELQQYLHEFSFRKVVGGEFEEWNGEELRLPVHELHASDGEAELEVLLNEVQNGQWSFRRNPDITFPEERFILHALEGMPYLNPAVVLLYKAKHMREKDHQDFMAVKGRLDEWDRRWLLNAMRVHLPEHQWTKELGEGLH